MWYAQKMKIEGWLLISSVDVAYFVPNERDSSNLFFKYVFDVLVIGVLDGDLLLVLQGMIPEMEEREGGSESVRETEIETDEATLAEGVAERETEAVGSQ